MSSWYLLKGALREHCSWVCGSRMGIGRNWTAPQDPKEPQLTPEEVLELGGLSETSQSEARDWVFTPLPWSAIGCWLPRWRSKNPDKGRQCLGMNSTMRPPLPAAGEMVGARVGHPASLLNSCESIPFFFFLATPWSLWDLSFPTRNRIPGHCSESTEF